MNIRPIRTKEELDAAHECAKADNHILVWPSHIIEKEKYIVGALTLMPMVLVWMDTKKTTVRDSQQMQTFYEGLIANQSRVVCVPCVPKSPYFKYMNKAGYIDVGNVNLFVKGL